MLFAILNITSHAPKVIHKFHIDSHLNF